MAAICSIQSAPSSSCYAEWDLGIGMRLMQLDAAPRPVIKEWTARHIHTASPAQILSKSSQKESLSKQPRRVSRSEKECRRRLERPWKHGSSLWLWVLVFLFLWSLYQVTIFALSSWASGFRVRCGEFGRRKIRRVQPQIRQRCF